MCTFGRTALCLSGGGGMAFQHFGVVEELLRLGVEQNGASGVRRRDGGRSHRNRDTCGNTRVALTESGTGSARMKSAMRCLAKERQVLDGAQRAIKE